MAYQQKEGDIAIFFNDKKTNENQPDWRGRCLVDGQEKEVAFWYKNSGMMTGKVSEPRQRSDAPKQVGASVPDEFAPTKHEKEKADGYQPQVDPFDDDIPF